MFIKVKQNVIDSNGDYYSAIKRNEVLINATTYMDLESLCQVKANHESPRRVPFLWNVSVGKLRRQKGG